jgi:N-acetylglucosaminyldiphosphoundecaprenol N-acetyl-beta-D-mannosaminyltransferase
LATLTSADADVLQEARRKYFGTLVNPRSFTQWLSDISRVVNSGQRRWLIGHHNLHSLYLLQSSHDVRRFYDRCDDCYVDGTPVRLLLRFFGVPTTSVQRFSLMDHFLELLEHAEHRDWSVFYLGSREPVVVAGRKLIENRFPRLRIQLHHGYSPDSTELVRAINASRPDVLLVGMGMPLQEQWLLQHLDKLDVGVTTQAGATLDYYTGAQARPPLWLSRMGFAWAYRLARDPARLWRRYLVEPWGLLPYTLHHWRRFRSVRQTIGE